jgi:hypothetical protein
MMLKRSEKHLKDSRTHPWKSEKLFILSNKPQERLDKKVNNKAKINNTLKEKRKTRQSHENE